MKLRKYTASCIAVGTLLILSACGSLSSDNNQGGNGAGLFDSPDANRSPSRGYADSSGNGNRNGSDRFDRPGNAEEPEVRRRAKIRLELAVNYFQSKQNKIALDEVNNALSADPEFADAHVLKGLILMDANQSSAADDSFKQALRISPADADANNTYGWFLCQNNRASQSFAYFERAATTAFYSTPIKPLLNAGICSAKQASYSQAESYYLRAQAIDDSSITLQYHFAQLYLKMNDTARAMAYTRKLLSSSKPNAETLWLGIRVSRKANDAAALAQLTQLLRDDFITSPQWSLYVQNRFEE
jgi:type IV pilus assembly protein PilF